MSADDCGIWGWATTGDRMRIYCNQKPGHDGPHSYRSSRGERFTVQPEAIVGDVSPAGSNSPKENQNP